MIVFDAFTGETILLDGKHAHTIDGETRLVELIVYENGKRVEVTEWDEELLVESAADMMTLTLPYFKDKRVLIIKLSEWKRGKRVDIPKELKCNVCGKIRCECDEDTFLGLI